MNKLTVKSVRPEPVEGYERLITIILFTLLGLAHTTHASQELAVSNSTTPQQCTLAIILDLVDEESSANSKAAQISVANLLASDEVCILTTMHTLQNLANITPRKLEEGAFLIGDQACRKINAREIYSDGFFALLLPKRQSLKFKHSMDLTASGLNPFFKQFVGKQPSSRLRQNMASLNSLAHNMFIDPFSRSLRTAKFMKLLNSLLIKQDNVVWNIYMLGHGDPNNDTCGIPESAFKQLLKFFADNINTRLLIYDSCFAGGKMSEYIFEDQAQYPYLIICRGLGDNEVIVDSNCDNVLANLTKIKKTYDLKEIAACLPARMLPYKTKNGPLARISLSALYDHSFQIRLPHSTQFVLQAADKAEDCSAFVVDQNTPAELFKNPPAQTIILNTPHLTNTLNVGKKFNILTALKGDNLHYIEKINASSTKYGGFYWKLYNINFENGLVPKIFLIKQVALKDNTLDYCMAFLNSPTPDNYLGIQMPDDMENLTGKSFAMFYTAKGRGFLARKGKSKTLTAKQTMAYLELFQQLHERIQNGEQPRRLIDNKHIRWLSQFRGCLLLGYLAAGGYAGMQAYHGMDWILPDCLSDWIQQPISITSGLAAGSLTTLGSMCSDYIIGQKLRYYDLAKK